MKKSSHKIKSKKSPGRTLKRTGYGIYLIGKSVIFAEKNRPEHV